MKAVEVHLWTFLHSLLCFVVERALCSLYIRCSSVLSRGLRSGDEWKKCDGHWGYRIEVGARQKWIRKRGGGGVLWTARVSYKNLVVVYQL